MPRENAAAKSRRYVAEARLVVTSVHNGRVTSTCRGDGAIWEQSYRAGVWSCSCPARTADCAHLRALRLVTAVDITEGTR